MNTFFCSSICRVWARHSASRTTLTRKLVADPNAFRTFSICAAFIVSKLRLRLPGLKHGWVNISLLRSLFKSSLLLLLKVWNLSLKIWDLSLCRKSRSLLRDCCLRRELGELRVVRRLGTEILVLVENRSILDLSREHLILNLWKLVLARRNRELLLVHPWLTLLYWSGRSSWAAHWTTPTWRSIPGTLLASYPCALILFPLKDLWPVVSTNRTALTGRRRRSVSFTHLTGNGGAVGCVWSWKVVSSLDRKHWRGLLHCLSDIAVGRAALAWWSVAGTGAHNSGTGVTTAKDRSSIGGLTLKFRFVSNRKLIKLGV